MSFRKIIMITVLLLVQPVIVFANSSPTYWKGYPYSEVLLVDENSPIAVKQEKLTFDFNESFQEESRIGFSPTAKVTAEYEMQNTSDQDLSVQMAFPFVGSISKLSIKDLLVDVEGKPVPYEVYPAKDEVQYMYDSEQEFRYSGFHISTEELKFPGIDLTQDAKLIRYSIEAIDEEDLRFEIRFDADPNKTRVIASNFSMISYDEEDGSAVGATIFDKERSVELLVLGEDCRFIEEVLTEEGKQADPGNYRLKKEVILVSPRQYLSELIHQYLPKEVTDSVSNTQLLNLSLSRIWSDGLVSGCSMMDDAMGVFHSERIITLIYSVDFPAGAEKQVRVGYLTGGTMDRRETPTPKYTYTYLLSPAKHWKSFGILDIEILTPEEAPYIIGSSLALEPVGERRYTSSLGGLPEEELVFTLYQKEEVGKLDQIQKSLDGLRYLPVLLSILWPFLLIILFIASLLWWKKRRREQ